MNHLELEQHVQRFAGEFISRVSSAGEPLAERAERAELRDLALNRILLYASSALDICSGPTAEVNMLDMAVFVRLSRSAYERHFLPRFGDAGRPWLDVLKTSESEIWELASDMLGPQDFGELVTLTQAWLDKHPDNVNVEVVRLREFAEHVGELVAGFDKERSGLFGRLKGVTQTADHAVLFGERALFLAQRMPFLLRLQARVGARDIIRDSTRSLKDATRGWAKVGSYALLGTSGALALWGGYRLMMRASGRR